MSPGALAFLAALLLPSPARAAAPPAPVRWSSAAYVRAVLELSPEAGQAAEDLAAASLRWRSALADAVLPTFSLDARTYPYGHDPDRGNRFDRWGLASREVSHSMTARWNLFNSFSDSLSARAARQERDASAQALDAERQTQALAALNAFYSLFLRERLAEVARENLRAQEKQYKLTQDLYKHGMKSLSDLLKSETDWRSSELRLASAEGDLRAALLGFNNLLSRDPGTPAETAPPTVRDGPPPSLEEGLRRAPRQRPELLRGRIRLDRARTLRAQAVQDSLPTFAADAFWTRSDPLTRPNPRYYLALTLSLPSGFNLFSQAADVMAAGADVRSSAHSLAALERSVREEVYSSHIDLERALRSHAVAVRKEEISRRNLDLVLEQYRQGSADVIKLNQAQLDYLNAQTERARALFDANVQDAQYRLSIGDRLW